MTAQANTSGGGSGNFNLKLMLIPTAALAILFVVLWVFLRANQRDESTSTPPSSIPYSTATPNLSVAGRLVTAAAPASQDVAVRCPDYGLQSQPCKIPAGECRETIQGAGAPAGFTFSFDPMTDSGNDDVYSRIRYKNGIGGWQVWTGSPAKGATGWEFCAKQDIEMNYGLSQA